MAKNGNDAIEKRLQSLEGKVGDLRSTSYMTLLFVAILFALIVGAMFKVFFG
ncbi:MAG: hypothetical protein AABX01_03360 [Candidatus Micrarchaeota archaeon]